MTTEEGNKFISLDEFMNLAAEMVDGDEVDTPTPVPTEEPETGDAPITDEDEPTPEPEPAPFVPTSPLNSVVKSMLNSHDLEDFPLSHNGVEYESISDFIAENDVDEELFKGLILSREQPQGEYLDLSGLDTTRKEIVEAITKGLPYQKVLDTYDNVIQPLQNLDLVDDNQAKGLLFKYYKEIEGYDKEYIENYMLPKLVKEQRLTSTAEQVKNKYIESFNEIIANQKKEHEAEQLQMQQEFESAKNHTKELFKQKEYSDTFTKKGLELLFGQNADGIPDWVVEVGKRMADDNFKVEFTHWMLDQEDYINKKTATTRRKDTLKRISTTDLRNKTKASEGAKETDDGLFGLPFVHQTNKE